MASTITNKLTQAVIKLFFLYRGWAVRVNTQGQIRNGEYTYGTTMPGTPDIIGCVNGAFYGVEIKSPKDKLSENQKKVKLMIEAAGGIYIECRKIEDVKFVIDLYAKEAAGRNG